jgi:hypothetical protein
MVVSCSIAIGFRRLARKVRRENAKSAKKYSSLRDLCDFFYALCVPKKPNPITNRMRQCKNCGR